MNHRRLDRRPAAAALAALVAWQAGLFAPVLRAPSADARAQAAADAAQPSAAAPRLVAELPGYAGPPEFKSRPVLLAFSPDGRSLALSADDRSVKLFDASDGRLKATLRGDKLGFDQFAFTPDGRLALARDALGRAVRVWEADTGKLLHTLVGRRPGVETKMKAAGHRLPAFMQLPLSPDGAVAATEREDDVLTLWDVESGAELRAIEHKTETNAAKDVLKLAVPFTTSHVLNLSASFGRDGRRLTTANGDKQPKLWDAATGRLVAVLGPQGDRVYAALFTPDGRTVLTISTGGEVSLWDAEAGGKLSTLAVRDGMPDALALSRDGKRAALQFGDRTRLLDAGTGRLLGTLEKNKARLLIFSPDGRTLAAAGGGDAAARLWDFESASLRSALPRPADATDFMAFSPDGRRLLVGGANRTALLYELPGR